jgi:hypothetical protein
MNEIDEDQLDYIVNVLYSIAIDGHADDFDTRVREIAELSGETLAIAIQKFKELINEYYDRL